MNEIPIEEANQVLFGSENGLGTGESKRGSQTRLLQQKIVQDFSLSPVPYYKKPSVKVVLMILLGIPIVWIIWSAFGGSPQAAAKKEENPYSQENEQLKASLEETRQELQQMKVEKTLENQQQEIQLIEPEKEVPPPPAPAKEPEAPPKQKPTPQRVQAVRVAQPPRPIPQKRPLVHKAPVVPVVKKEVIPEKDSMEQWLAQSERGYSRTSFNKTNSDTHIASNIPFAPPPIPVIRSKRHSPPVELETPPEGTDIAVNTQEIREIPRTPLFDEARLTAIQKDESLFSDEELQARLDRGGKILAGKQNYVAVNNIENKSNRNPLSTEAYGVENRVEDLYTSRKPKTSKVLTYTSGETTNDVNSTNLEASETNGSGFIQNANQVLDIGSKAKATLLEGIAWAQEGLGQNSNRKYVLYLEEGFENSGGVEVLPSGTRLIAEVDEVSGSGLFTMKVIQVVKGFDQPKINVPEGTLEIVAKDGSPLQAKLKRKGNSDFMSDLGAVIAPGVERALDSGTNILVNDGSGFSFSSSKNKDPLSSGLSGVADGVGDLVRERTRRNSNQTRTLSYFQFKAEQTVQIIVNEDFLIK